MAERRPRRRSTTARPASGSRASTRSSRRSRARSGRCRSTRRSSSSRPLLDLYGEGLARIVAHVADRDEDGALARALAGDELVSHLLLLHGLHPVPLDARVRGALAEVRPYLESHGGDVELLGIEDGVVRLAMRGSCDGCASSTMTLKLAIEEAIQRAAPDVEEIVAEGAVEAAPPRRAAADRALGRLLAPAADADDSWTAAGELARPVTAPVVRTSAAATCCSSRSTGALRLPPGVPGVRRLARGRGARRRRARARLRRALRRPPRRPRARRARAPARARAAARRGRRGRPRRGRSDA